MLCCCREVLPFELSDGPWLFMLRGCLYNGVSCVDGLCNLDFRKVWTLVDGDYYWTEFCSSRVGVSVLARLEIGFWIAVLGPLGLRLLCFLGLFRYLSIWDAIFGRITCGFCCRVLYNLQV